MSRIWSFHGGIHPAENKQQSLSAPLRQLPMPERLILPLQQHIGTPAEAIVNVGDHVLKGQKIAEPSGFVSIFMHAPTSGTVVEIAEYPIPHPSGMNDLCIVIEPDGKDQWITHQAVNDFRQLEKSQLAEVIRCAGISGMGGAGFPTDIKLHLSDDHIVNTLIINGIECEPYITSDDMLMRTYADKIIAGIEIAAYLIKPTHILIGIEDNKPQAAMAMIEACRDTQLNIEVVVVPTKYPSGGERQLIKLVTGVEVPHGHLPADIGIVVQNVGTMAAVHDAVVEGKPLISRITTITGEGVTDPGNIEVLLGTPINDLLRFCGVQIPEVTRLIMGGPMMGYSLEDAQVPVIKTSNCVIAGTSSDFPLVPPAQECIRCSSCEQVCPVELLPQQLYWFAKGNELDKSLSHNLVDCIECGACSYVCPSNIPLVQYYRYSKAEVRKEQQEQQKSEQARIRFEARQARLEAAQQEKEARRKARAEDAAKKQASKRDKAAAADAKTENNTAVDAQAQLKQLKTQAAIARTKVKKAEKAVAQAEESGADNLNELRSELESSQQKAQSAQQALNNAEKAAPAATTLSNAGPSLKELKTAAAVARTKVTKTEKALADAEGKGAPSADKLRVSLDTLREKADKAQRLYEAAEKNQDKPARSAATASAITSASTAADIKALKSAAAIARTKLKKAEKAVAQGGDDLEALKRALAEQAEKTRIAQAAFDEAEAASGSEGAASSSTSADIKALKTAAAVARTKVKKTEKALADAKEKQSPAMEQLKTALVSLKEKATAAQKALDAAQAEQPANPEQTVDAS